MLHRAKKFKATGLKLQAGFTMLELLLYMAILAIVTVFLVQAFFNLNRGQGENQAQSDVNSNLAFAAEKIDADLRAASSVATPATAGATSSNLVMTVNGTTVQYCMLNGVLYRQLSSAACSSASTQITAASVTVGSPTFTRIENTNTTLGKTFVTVQSILTVSNSSQNPEGQFSMSKQLTSALR